MRPDDASEPEPEEDEPHPGHHGGEQLHGQVRRVQKQHGHGEGGPHLMTDMGHERSGHG